MRSRFSVLFLAPLLCAALASPLAAGVNRWTPIGPGGGYVNVITAAPSRPATLYAGLNTGGVLAVSSIRIDPAEPSTLYASGSLTSLACGPRPGARRFDPDGSGH